MPTIRDGQIGALADELLAQAHELLAEGWCQGASASDEYGRAIEPSSAWARRWSAAGALERAWRRSTHDPDLALAAFQLANLALSAAVKGVPQRWNDREGRHVSEVLDAVAEAGLLLAALETDRGAPVVQLPPPVPSSLSA